MHQQRCGQQQGAKQICYSVPGASHGFSVDIIGIGSDDKNAPEYPDNIGPESVDHFNAISLNRASNPGKLVSMGDASSMVTPALVINPATAKLIAIR